MDDQHPGAARRVLVADDTETVSHLMMQLLERAGYETRLARDGEACLDEVAAFKPDLLILDLMMPRLHGIEVMRRLRADPGTADLGVVVCSAKSFKTEQATAAALGAYAFLPKPHEPDELLGVVAAFSVLARLLRCRLPP